MVAQSGAAVFARVLLSHSRTAITVYCRVGDPG